MVLRNRPGTFRCSCSPGSAAAWTPGEDQHLQEETSFLDCFSACCLAAVGLVFASV